MNQVPVQHKCTNNVYDSKSNTRSTPLSPTEKSKTTTKF